MIEIFWRPQQHTKANFQYNFIIQKTFKVCILSCQRASVPFSTGPGGKELSIFIRNVYILLINVIIKLYKSKIV